MYGLWSGMLAGIMLCLFWNFICTTAAWIGGPGGKHEFFLLKVPYNCNAMALLWGRLYVSVYCHPECDIFPEHSSCTENLTSVCDADVQIWLLGIIYMLSGFPLSYFLWYRPLYRAMRYCHIQQRISMHLSLAFMVLGLVASCMISSKLWFISSIYFSDTQALGTVLYWVTLVPLHGLKQVKGTWPHI